jgi:hypothetical protein
MALDTGYFPVPGQQLMRLGFLGVNLVAGVGAESLLVYSQLTMVTGARIIRAMTATTMPKKIARLRMLYPQVACMVANCNSPGWHWVRLSPLR